MKTEIYTKGRKKERRRLELISGKCLEREGLIFTNGTGYAVIDCTVRPKVGDLVHCDNRLGTIHGFIKKIKEIKDGVYIVGNAYEDTEKDFTFEASVIYGVVTMVFDGFKRNQLYNRSERNKLARAKPQTFGEGE